MRGRRRLARNGGRTLSRAFGASSPASGRGERITLRANKQHRAFALPRLVIARSGSDQAIQLPAQAALDCFADARNDASLIPPRVAGRGDRPKGRWEGRRPGRQLHRHTPPPPPFGRSPSPASRGRIKKSILATPYAPELCSPPKSVRKPINKKKGCEAPKGALSRQLPLARQRDSR